MFFNQSTLAVGIGSFCFQRHWFFSFSKDPLLFPTFCILVAEETFQKNFDPQRGKPRTWLVLFRFSVTVT